MLLCAPLAPLHFTGLASNGLTILFWVCGGSHAKYYNQNYWSQKVIYVIDVLSEPFNVLAPFSLPLSPVSILPRHRAALKRITHQSHPFALAITQ